MVSAKGEVDVEVEGSKTVAQLPQLNESFSLHLSQFDVKTQLPVFIILGIISDNPTFILFDLRWHREDS